MTQEFEAFKKDALKDPLVAAEYNKLKSEYAIAAALIRARVSAKMSQAEVAKEMHTSQSHIARLESGEHLPSLKTIHKYADAVKLPIRLEIYPS